MTVTVVLVHGAWHGAWCWERIVAGLESAAVPVVALDLPGHGASTEPLGDLHGDIAHLRGVLDGIDGPVVLVGHSYGGAVITGAGDHPAVRRLVYVAAFNVDEGEAVAAAGADLPGIDAIDHSGRPNLGHAMQLGDDGTIGFDPTMARAIFYNDCAEAEAVWATERLGPQPAATFAQAPEVIGWRTTPSTYVVCGNDQAVHPDLQRLLATRASDVEELATDHSPFLSMPAELTALLAGEAHALET